MKIIVIIALLIFVKNINGQVWVEEMQDPDVNFYTVQQSFLDHWGNRNIERGLGYKQFKRWEYFMEPRVYPTGNRPSPVANYIERLNFESKFPPIEQKSSNWTSLGPNSWTNPTGWNPGNGRVNCITEDPNNSNIIYIGSPSGGIWRSLNSGSTWTPLSDDFICMGISSIVISNSNSNLIYAATGDGDGSDTYSIGVVKSVDGGLTWSTTDLNYVVTSAKKVYKLLIHPTNDQILWAATNNGFYKTTDGGDNWVRKNNYSIRDIELNPANPNTIYASGISTFYSNDGGNSFTASSGLPATSIVGRVAIAVTEADSNYVYALASSVADNGLLGVYRSVDGGITYDLRYDTTNLLGYSEDGTSSGGQGWYDLAIACSHSNKERIVVGGVNVWRSNDGGNFFTIISHWVHPSSVGYTHADIHCLDYIGAKLYCGSDGGIFQSYNSGTTWTDLSEGLEVSQFYKIGLTEQNADLIIGGLQDNGTFMRKASGWEHIRGGDGMEAIIDPSDQNTWYTCYQNGSMNKTTDGGINFFGISDSIIDNGGWVTPYVINPSNTDILYAGYSAIWKTVDGGLDWEKVSPSGTTIQYVEISSADPDVVYYSSYNDIWRTDDAGATWVNCNSNLPSGQWISSFTISPTNPNVVFLTLSGYTSGKKVYVTNNAGASWDNITVNLPNIPVNCIVYEAGSNAGLYIGTDNGVYYKDSNLVYWQTFDDGLPNVIVNELNIHYATATIRAGTYGRGVWESPLKGPLGLPLADFKSDFNDVCPGQIVHFFDNCSNHGPLWSWSFPGGIPATSTDQNPIVTYPALGTYDVQLIVNNATGSDTIDKLHHISVDHPLVNPLDLFEDFESGINSEWVINNPDLLQGWKLEPFGAYGLSDSCIAIDNYSQNFLAIDEFFSAAFDASNESEIWLQFDYAYGRNSGYKKDSLAIYTTSNCGGMVNHEWQEGGTNLATVSGLFTGPFSPEPTYWTKVTVDVSNVIGDSSVKIIFRNIGRQGNWLYIDNINITNYQPATNTSEIEKPNISVYPNPGTGFFNVQGLPIGTVYEIYDYAGRMLIESDNPIINLSRYSAGIYILKTKVSGTPQMVRIAKK